MRLRTLAFVGATLILLAQQRPVWTQTVTLPVVTWNIAHGDRGIENQLSFLWSLNPTPDVIVFQEMAPEEIDGYIAGLEARTPGQSWYHRFAAHCARFGSTGTTCHSSHFDGVAIMSRRQILAHSSTLLWGRDDWTDARAALRARIDVDGRPVEVFAVHLAAGDDYSALRRSQVADLKNWMNLFGTPRIAGGDFNGPPHFPEITDMTAAYTDAWEQLRPTEDDSSSWTWCAELSTICAGGRPLEKRIDYWFYQQGPSIELASVARPTFPSQPLSDHLPVTARFTLQASSPTNTPYLGIPADVPGIVEAEKFDEGGEEVAYHDVDTGNNGGQFRPNEDVDIATTSDPPAGYTLGWVRPGEWLKYTVDVAASTNYTLDARVATPNNDGRFHLEVDDVNVTGSLTMPNTNSFETWDTATQRGVYLTAGSHVLKFFAESTGGPGPSVGNLNYLRLTSGGTAGAFGPIAVPGIVQAEEFDPGAYHDEDPENRGGPGAYRNSEGVDIAQTADTGGGYTVGWFGAQEWLSYTIDVAATGTYTLEARVASNGTGGTFHVEVDGTDRTGAMPIPNTGGWDAWQTIPKTGISLTAGQHTLTVVGDTVGPSTLAVGNLNYLRLIPGGGGGETNLLSDDFNAASLNGAEWSVAVLSGSQDPNVPVQQSGGTLNIGPLFENTSGFHYNGILSQRTFNLIGGYARVQCVTPPNAGTTVATMQLTLPIDASNHYRQFVEDGHIWFEKKINGTKVRPRIPFDPVQHAFWQIRHDQATNEIVFETAPNAGGVPGTWVERHRILRELSLDAVHVELRAGTWDVQSNPGTVRFDNVRVGKP